jgi:hypothetical protein
VTANSQPSITAEIWRLRCLRSTQGHYLTTNRFQCFDTTLTFVNVASSIAILALTSAASHAKLNREFEELCALPRNCAQDLPRMRKELDCLGAWTPTVLSRYGIKKNRKH